MTNASELHRLLGNSVSEADMKRYSELKESFDRNLMRPRFRPALLRSYLYPSVRRIFRYYKQASSGREGIGQEVAIVQLGYQPSKVVAVTESAQTMIAAGLQVADPKRDRANLMR